VTERFEHEVAMPGVAPVPTSPAEAAPENLAALPKRRRHLAALAAAALVAALITGASMYAVRQSRHIAAANHALADMTGQRNGALNRIGDLERDKAVTEGVLATTRTNLSTAESDLAATRSRATKADTKLADAQASLLRCSHAIDTVFNWLIDIGKAQSYIEPSASMFRDAEACHVAAETNGWSPNI
jgi:hypothetical protein